MSRVGKQILKIPTGTTVNLNGETLTVKGSKGELARDFKTRIISIDINGEEITFTPKNEEGSTKALWGTYASHVKNMIKGVNDPFVKKLILEGVGFKSEVTGDSIKLALGFSHPVIVTIPTDLKVTAEKNPKYLDLLIEVAILLNDKKMAMDAYNELRLVNPENQKLDSFKSRIGELE
jgi:large subunit ribosomal protein L6